MNEQDQRVLAGKVAGRSSLATIRLMSSSIEHVDFAPPGARLEYAFDVSPSAQYEPGDEHLIVRVDYALQVRASVESDEKDAASEVLAHAEFTYVALFVADASEEFTEAEVESFAQTTGAFAIYPYAREYVQDVTGRLGLPPLTLGLFKVTE